MGLSSAHGLLSYWPTDPECPPILFFFLPLSSPCMTGRGLPIQAGGGGGGGPTKSHERGLLLSILLLGGLCAVGDGPSILHPDARKGRE